MECSLPGQRNNITNVKYLVASGVLTNPIISICKVWRKSVTMGGHRVLIFVYLHTLYIFFLMHMLSVLSVYLLGFLKLSFCCPLYILNDGEPSFLTTCICNSCPLYIRNTHIQFGNSSLVTVCSTFIHFTNTIKDINQIELHPSYGYEFKKNPDTTIPKSVKELWKTTPHPPPSKKIKRKHNSKCNPNWSTAG